ncbi:MAG TPA: MFS transporter [Thermoanaerobaculia bacterium]|nr:MFS transporter [Thermoanaerobaculia bacterium]
MRDQGAEREPGAAPGTRPDAAGGSRTSLAVVYFTVFLDMLGFGLVLPVLPYWARELGASGLALGTVLTSYSLAQLFGSTVFGRLSDRYGRRPLLLASLAGTTVSMLLSAAAPTLGLLAGARALAGFFGGSIATAQAYIADRTDLSERPRAMGLLGAAIGLGFVLGPALGAAVVALGFGFPTAALIAATLALANLLIAAVRLEESHVSRAERPGRLATLRRHWSDGPMRSLLLANFFLTGSFVVLETTFAYFGAVRFGLGAAGFGLVMFGIGAVMVVVQGSLFGSLSQRFGVAALARSGAALCCVALLVLPLFDALPFAVAALALIAVGRALAAPSLSTLVSVGAGDEQGALMGLLQSLAAASRASIPVLAGWLYDVEIGLPYLAGSGLALVGLLLLWGVRRPHPATEPARRDL